jgi:DNA-binding CsgD family transcriptional regulator
MAETTGPYALVCPYCRQPVDAVERDDRYQVEDSVLATLSARELEVVELLGEGLGNREISARLTIAERTVKKHVSTILTKLSVSSRLQAGLFAASFSRRRHLFMRCSPSNPPDEECTKVH